MLFCTHFAACGPLPIQSERYCAAEAERSGGQYVAVAPRVCVASRRVRAPLVPSIVLCAALCCAALAAGNVQRAVITDDILCVCVTHVCALKAAPFHSFQIHCDSLRSAPLRFRALEALTFDTASWRAV